MICFDTYIGSPAKLSSVQPTVMNIETVIDRFVQKPKKGQKNNLIESMQKIARQSVSGDFEIENGLGIIHMKFNVLI